MLASRNKVVFILLELLFMMEDLKIDHYNEVRSQLIFINLHKLATQTWR